MTDGREECPVCEELWFEACFHCGWPRVDSPNTVADGGSDVGPKHDSPTSSDSGPMAGRGAAQVDVPEATHPEYRAIANQYVATATDPVAAARPLNDGPEIDRGIEYLRGRSPAERALAAVGYHASNVGISVTTVSAWKRKRSFIKSHSGDILLYDYLVRDAAGCTLAFWRARNGVADHEQFLQGAVDGEYSSSAENAARTFRWGRDTIGAPDQLETRQANLIEF